MGWRFPLISDVYLLTIVYRFLLVSLNIEAILGEITISQRRKKLKEMVRGNGLSDAYTATLTRLKAQKGNRPRLGVQALMWVLFSKRPLQTEELCHALGVETGSAELDPENIPGLRTLLSSCLGLLTVEESSSTVRLVHFTLQEHFLKDSTLPHRSHSAIAEVCLTYLNFGSVRELSPTLGSTPSTLPLLEYASLYWGAHTRWGMTERVKILVGKFTKIYTRHISHELLGSAISKGRVYCAYLEGKGGLTGYTGLGQVAVLGAIYAIATLLEKREEGVNAADWMGNAALINAVQQGQEAVVQMLLDRRDVDPNRGDTDSWTPLSWASMMGHEGIVKLLLAREDVNCDQPDFKYGQAPISWAAMMGHEGIVKLLLEREDVNPDQLGTKYGQTPLPWAAEKGHGGVVKILLGREGVNPDQPDTRYGQTPLSWAAAKGHEGVVKMLLDRGGVDPDRPDTKCGQTPFSWAAVNRHVGVMMILLELVDVNPDQPDTKYGLAPISWAAMMGHKEVVKILLEREDLNLDQPDTEYGRTPLSWAAERGHEGVVKMLSERVAVNPRQSDTGCFKRRRLN